MKSSFYISDWSVIRLADWLAGRFGGAPLLRTPPAPVFDVDDLDPRQVAGLDALEQELDDHTLSLSPHDRYQALIEGAEGFRAQLELVRRHEGLAPSTIATLRPSAPLDVRRLSRLTARAGLTLVSPGVAGGDVALDRRGLGKVVVDGATRRLHIQRGTSWAAIDAALQDHGTPPLGETFQGDGPAFEVLQSGLVGGRPATARHGHSLSVDLPPAARQVRETVWLFTSADTALAAFEAVAAHHDPLLMDLYDADTILLGHEAGLWDLPRRRLPGTRPTALRLAFAGTGAQTRFALFLASWSIESRGGVVWRHSPLPALSRFLPLVLETGCLGVLRSAVPASPREWDRDTPPEGGLTLRRLRWRLGRLQLDRLVIAPRAFEDPAGQFSALWDSLVGDEAPQDTAPADDRPHPDSVESSLEWQEIRSQLLSQVPPGPTRPPLRREQP